MRRSSDARLSGRARRGSRSSQASPKSPRYDASSPRSVVHTSATGRRPNAGASRIGAHPFAAAASRPSALRLTRRDRGSEQPGPGLCLAGAPGAAELVGDVGDVRGSAVGRLAVAVATHLGRGGTERGLRRTRGRPGRRRQLRGTVSVRVSTSTSRVGAGASLGVCDGVGVDVGSASGVSVVVRRRTAAARPRRRGRPRRRRPADDAAGPARQPAYERTGRPGVAGHTAPRYGDDAAPRWGGRVPSGQ